MDGYAELVALAEREHELVSAGRFDELAELHALREELVGTLPAVAPAEARPALERAQRLHVEVHAALRRAVAGTAAELGHVSRSRQAARGYAPALGDGRTLDRAG